MQEKRASLTAAIIKILERMDMERLRMLYLTAVRWSR